VTKTEGFKISYSGKSIAKNTIYNLTGYGIPLLVAVVLIPPLIKGLGDERFGILNLAWIVIGYFSFFDFGIGRGLTKIISERIGTNRKEEIPDIFWTSFFLMLAISSVVATVLAFFMPHIVEIFNISKGMYTEVLMTFYALTFAIPIVSTTAGLRGVLEAYQKFKNINLIRIFLGIFTFLGPLLVLFIINSLFWIVVVMILIRIFVWVLYLYQCFVINDSIKRKIVFKFDSVKPVLKFSMWITIANIVGPIIVNSDRFLIGALVSATAITYYATPYQIITKILLIPGALLGVLFPIFSASFQSDPSIARKIFLRAVKIIFLIIYPTILLVVTFAYDFMQLWLGEKFALNSSLVLQLLAIGILMNSISIVPNNYFQGIGKPKIPTLINLIELPFYITVMFLSIKGAGINGAAMTYMVAASIDAFVMCTAAYMMGVLKIKLKYIIILFLFLAISLSVPFMLNVFYIKIIFTIGIISIFSMVTWFYILSTDERILLINKLKITLNIN